MSPDTYDDGLVHGHDWAVEPMAAYVGDHKRVADASIITTPSCVLHDDLMEMAPA